MATIRGEKKDRPALSLTLSLYGAKLTACPLDEYYTNPTRYIEGQVAVFEEIGPDIIFGPFSFPLLGKAFGSEIKLYRTQAPNLKSPVVKNQEDIKNLDFEKTINSSEVGYFTQSINELVKKLGDKVPIAPIMLSPVDLPIMIMGLENWLEMVLSDIEKAYKLIEKTTDFFLKLTDDFFESGASFIVMPSLFTNPSVITKSIALHFQDILQVGFSQTKGALFLHEGGARLIPFLEIFKSLPHVVGMLINRDDDLTVARDLLGGNLVLAGNFEGPDLPEMSTEEISLKVKNIINNRADDPHFILASSGADIPYDTPIEKIRMIKKTLEKFYGY